MRIALVNDLAVALAGLRRVVASIEDAEVAWSAMDGQEAIERCRADTPDLILMDMIMPVVDGVEATRQIMKECPCPIVVVTATVEGNAERVYEALGHGALDAVNTPVLGPSGDVTGAEALISKIRTVRLLTGVETRGVRPEVAKAPEPHVPGTPHETGPSPALVAVGASTGGPQALVVLLRELPRPLTCPVVVVQHVDVKFASGLADWLQRETGFPVRTIRHGDRLEPAVLLAATEDHLVLRGGVLRYEREPADEVYRPSVDVFFESLCRADAAPGVAVLLTGMGRDGATGLLSLRRAGWHTIAQDKSTSVVWGMPGAAVAIDAACEVLEIERIGSAVAQRCAAVGRGTES